MNGPPSVDDDCSNALRAFDHVPIQLWLFSQVYGIFAEVVVDLPVPDRPSI